MAGKKENIKALFSNSRSRIIILFTVILLLVSVVIGVIKFTSSSGGVDSAVSLTAGGQNIQSTPGSMNQTAQYAALQTEQNAEQAKLAIQTGTSAIPTIISTQAFGEAGVIIGQKEGEGGVDFSALSRDDLTDTPKLWNQSLSSTNCSAASLAKAVSQGAVASDLSSACSCTQLKNNGFKLPELEPICTCAELKLAGFDIIQFKEAGFSATRLRLCGFTACDEKGIGFTAQAMKDAGFSDGELKGAGFSDQDIARAGGVPDGMTVADIQKAGCDVDALARLRATGVTAAAIRRISGCSIDQLKAAGFTAEDLRNAGYSAAELKNAGFGPAELKQAGFTAKDLLNAGFSPDVTDGAIHAAGCDPDKLKVLMAQGVSAKRIRDLNGCSADALKLAGFDAKALADAGFSAADLKNAGYTAADLKNAAMTAAQLKQAGYSPEDLFKAGFTPQQLSGAGFTAAQLSAAQSAVNNAIHAAGCDPDKLKVLMAQGVSAKGIRDLNGCSADALKLAGFDAKALADEGFSPAELLAAGFTPDQLSQAGRNPTADCSVKSLTAAHALGVSAATIKQTLGCSALAMKAAGFSAVDLHNAGFTAAELKNAGFGLDALKNAGYSAKELNAAGWNAQQLKDAGFGNQQLKDAGFSATDLKNAGLSAEQLKAVGYDAKDLKGAGFSAEALHKAGYSAKDVKAAGFDQDQMKQAGYANQELQDAGFSTLAGLDAIASQSADPSSMTNLPTFDGVTQTSQASILAANAKRIDDIRKQQEKQMAAQRYQQEITQRGSAMLAAANQALQDWKVVPLQIYMAGTAKETDKQAGLHASDDMHGIPSMSETDGSVNNLKGAIVIKTGDIMFAVIDTSVNSDEPGPILATIVSGKLKGSKLIGSFNLPSNADKMIVSFNTLSVPGADKTVSVTAFAIDPNTARTALSSQTDNHYLSRYGALFASTFIEGFGNAFQSANTTITIGGTGGVTDTTVQSGVGRSTMENAVIGLATLGKAWGQVAARQMLRPTTVQLYAGTGVGVLFTQDMKVS